MAENLQLDRLLRIRSQAEPTVDLVSIEGITIQPMDWAPLVKQIHPQIDPLAAGFPRTSTRSFVRASNRCCG